MKTKLIEIQVRGFTGDGKTNVCAVIRDALVAAYGLHTQVASRDLSLEAGCHQDNRPTTDTVFVIRELNHGSMCTHNPDCPSPVSVTNIYSDTRQSKKESDK